MPLPAAFFTSAASAMVDGVGTGKGAEAEDIVDERRSPANAMMKSWLGEGRPVRWTGGRAG